MVIGVELDERRKLLPAYFLNAIATRRKWTTGFEMSDVRWQSRDLVQLALFGSWIGHRAKQSFGVGISGPGEQLSGRRLFKDLSGVHHDHVIRHSGDDAEI